jgi:hypothetical protein
MADTILADSRRPATTDEAAQQRRAAIQQRTTRGLLTFNTGKVHRLEGEVWAVPSTRGGFHQVDLAREECECEDFEFYGRDHYVACRHIYAAAIANASDARRRRGTTLRSLAALEDQLVHELMGDEERQELRDRVLALRRRLGR